MYREIFFAFLISLSLNLAAQNAIDSTTIGKVVFWTTQSWECDFIKIDVYDSDTNLVVEGKLEERYEGVTIPECGSEKSLTIEQLSIGSYFFVADCSKALCPICSGEGSYWQPIMHNKTYNGRGTKSKGDLEGTWKTCTTCEGNGSASQILWMDTFKVYSNYCRSVLLQ